MTVAQGCNSLDKAVAEVEALIRKLDQALTEGSVGQVHTRTHS